MNSRSFITFGMTPVALLSSACKPKLEHKGERAKGNPNFPCGVASLKKKLDETNLDVGEFRTVLFRWKGTRFEIHPTVAPKTID
jgi:hypothetical protein